MKITAKTCTNRNAYKKKRIWNINQKEQKTYFTAFHQHGRRKIYQDIFMDQIKYTVNVVLTADKPIIKKEQSWKFINYNFGRCKIKFATRFPVSENI